MRVELWRFLVNRIGQDVYTFSRQDSIGFDQCIDLVICEI